MPDANQQAIDEAREFAILHGQLSAESVVAFHNALKENGLYLSSQDDILLNELLVAFVKTLSIQR